MIISIPDEHLNDMQRNSIKRMLSYAKNMSSADVYVRIDGRDELFEADYLNHAKIIDEKTAN